MDSITHLFYGGAIAAAIAPPQHRRAALLAGAALNTLPDLDVIPLALFGDPVAQMTCHRGMTHSWFVLPFAAWAIWAFFRRRGRRVAQEPRRWFWAIMICLMAHPLIDAFTVYGTQLLWPLPMSPVMWSSLFIIDPLFTLPWLLACVVAWFALQQPFAQQALIAGIALGVSYVGWSLVAKFHVERAAQAALAQRGLQDAPRFSVPMPFNTLLWRVVAMTPDGYVEGERSLVVDRHAMQFDAHASDMQALGQAGDFSAVQRLTWFNHGFQKAEVRARQLVLSDLRMGSTPDFSFRFAVAERDAEGWREIAPQQLQWPWEARRRLPEMWWRIWNEPVVPVTAVPDPQR
ncbi:inner membrane protein [Luteimonas cucumeris]|uniref:Inner membrane protein n=1 Tax=Luteimonas cucumeris TaxID=985012 RepID=A0A562LFA0_9GAMM|nr:metal-dependent hydrolase [Luteimonas cucumeris]TWI06284.1 inner membrane protein [Luteimonas cucumeris]